MQKICVWAVMAAVCAGVCARGEKPMSAADAKALIEEVSLKNNLEGNDIKPWHIRLSYDVNNREEKKHYSGTIEEWWASDAQSRTEYVVNGQRKRVDVTDNGTYESGDLQHVPYSVGGVLTDVLWPMPASSTLAQMEFAGGVEKIQGAELRCVEMVRLSDVPDKRWGVIRGSKHWCMTASDPYLRIERYPANSWSFLRNNLLRFQDRTIAGEYIAAEGKTIVAETHIQKLEVLTQATAETIFRVPSDAAPEKEQRPIIVAGYMNGPILVYRVQPAYPEAAKFARLAGTVVLHGVIDSLGRITDLHAVFGPAALVPSAMQAVQQWLYIPLIIDGIPIPIRTTINVVYQIRG